MRKQREEQRCISVKVCRVEERKEDKEEHTWPEEPCSSFREEIEKRMDRIKKVTKKSYKGCEACRWQQLNGGTCKGGKTRCGQFVAEKE